MKGVVEYDRLEREKKAKGERGEPTENADDGAMAAAVEATPATAISGASARSAATPAPRDTGEESDDYEEVEVTDDEEEGNISKRQKTDEAHDDQHVEFNEDDIAYQLAAMGQDYGLDPGEYGEYEGGELEEGAEGLALTEEDSSALFMDMLNDYNISPYTTWEKLIEAGQIVEDDRYTVLPNMKTRKEVWGDWSHKKIQKLKELREREVKKDPRIPYLAFLQRFATPKLYWPEFRRKYKKEAEMRDTKLPDKDKEKLYREHINRTSCCQRFVWFGGLLNTGLKLSESTLKSDLAALIKFLPVHVFNRSTSLDNLPSAMLTDIRYISLKPSTRDPIIEDHISSLPPAPTDVDVSPEEHDIRLKQRQERERREKALAERQARVEEEKRRQRGALKYSKGMLREGEQELERAKKVGKEGLLGHMEKSGPLGSPSRDES